MPEYERYPRATTRSIPIVRLTPLAGRGSALGVRLEAVAEARAEPLQRPTQTRRSPLPATGGVIGDALDRRIGSARA